jgi:hypothetical protein
MKFSFLTSACFAVLLVGSANAAVSIDFTGITGNAPVANFAPRTGWTISDSTVDMSFVLPANAYGGAGNSVGLGGFYSTPSASSVRLSTAVSEALASKVFSIDLALVNRHVADAVNFFPENDRFGIVLGDAGGDLLNIDFTADPLDENIRQISVNGTPLPINGILASDYDSLNWYTLAISFIPSGANLNYSISTAGGVINTSGTLTGKAATTLTTIGVDFDVLGAAPINAGSNFLAVDNIKLEVIPEPTATLSGLLGLGLLAARRRR